MRYEKCKLLFGDDFVKIQKANIIILGAGGVGGYALDCLYKTGCQNITIVDYDIFEVSNQNRQIGSDAVGCSKVKHLQTLYPNIKIIETKIDFQWVDKFDMSSYDFILDAIDDIKIKLALIKKYHKNLITATASGKKTDPTKIEYKNIFETSNDPIAKILRKRLKKDNFKFDFKVICSTQEVQSKKLGSFVAVTGTFGLTMCSIVINKIKNSKI
jgi:tRNA A37 threonylcarbamoyladenosine dehydratase